MNIKNAKKYIEQSVGIYLKKGEFGEYLIPVERQRPIFLLGAPGVGKTAIMEQIAQEMGIALVSYSMTHHTRQSALGLPFIKHKTYEGMEYDVSEYTMSEIIATVYETMESSGIKEGILFLDEINCVSETLAPSMLQFLQYKVFGRHRVPDGWVIVTAGNPPEYNKSVREFDVVVLDRLKVIEVEADYGTWKEYARLNNVHSAIISFLDLKRDYFYLIENTVGGRSYVTARGWEDLSKMILLYEQEELQVSEELVIQYINNPKAVREFCAYYDLYNKYKRDYRINEILKGNAPEEAFIRAKRAGFDERLSLMGMLIDRVLNDIKNCIEKTDYLKELRPQLKTIKEKAEKGEDIESLIVKLRDGQEKQMLSMKRALAISPEELTRRRRIIRFYETLQKEMITNGSDFAHVKNKYDNEISEVKELSRVCASELHELFLFCEKAYEEGNEMLVLVTELTVNSYSTKFIARFGSEDYVKHNSELMMSERAGSLEREIDDIFDEIANA